MLTLAWPWWLLLAPLPWLLRRVLPGLPQRSEAALRAPVGLSLPASQNMRSATRGAWRALLLLWLAWLLLLLAAARP
ncbi:MAG: BatB protein, partial [Gammaproteobacteria bacterium]|nr:BatB protein [Gammaproteobacteria bacterium]